MLWSKEQNQSINTLLQKAQETSNSELEIRLGVFNNRFFESSISVSDFENLKQMHKSFNPTFFHIQDQFFTIDKKKWRKSTFLDEQNKKVSTIWTFKNKIDKVDILDWNMRISLATEDLITFNHPEFKQLEISAKETDNSLIRDKKRWSYKLTENVLLELTEVITETKNNKQISYEVEVEFKNIYNSNFISEIMEQLLKIYQRSNFILSNTEKNIILEHYKKLVKNNKNVFVGAQAITLQKNYIPQIVQNYAVTDKADGERRIMFVLDKHIVLINNKFDLVKISDNNCPEFSWTLIDGEYINNFFYAFDLIFYRGKDLRGDEQFDLKARLDKLVKINTFFKKSNKNPLFYIKNYYWPDSKNKNIFNLALSILNNPPSYKLDGLIFTPLKESYPQKKTWFSLYKWKFEELNSIDLKIHKKGKDNECEIWDLLVFNGKEYQLFKPDIDGYKNLWKTKVPLKIALNYEEGEIVEFVLQDKQLVPIRARKDKTMSNFIDTALDVLSNILNPITKNHLENLASLSESELNTINTNLSQYLKNTQSVESEMEETRFDNMRKFHNHIKDQLISKIAKNYKVKTLLSLGSGKGGDIHKWYKAGIKNVLGVDVNDNYIQEAYRRLKDSKASSYNYSFIKCDLTQKQILDTVDSYDKEKISQMNFEAVEAQFCWHYFFQNKNTFHNFMKNVLQFLPENGIFYGTILDGKLIHETPGPEIEPKKNGQTTFKLVKKYPYTSSYKELPLFGNKIQVSLKAETIDISEEYLIKFEDIVKLLKDTYNLELVETQMFENLYSDKYELKPYEKKYSFLSRYFVFKRIANKTQIKIKEALNIQNENTGLLYEPEESIRVPGFFYYKIKPALEVLKDCGIVHKNLDLNSYKKTLHYVLIEFNKNTNNYKILETNLDPQHTEEKFLILVKDPKSKFEFLFIPNKQEIFSTKIDWNRFNDSLVAPDTGLKVVDDNTLIENKRFKDYKLEELKNLCKKYELPVSGKKIELASRIINKK